jgi:hypothetical protein
VDGALGQPPLVAANRVALMVNIRSGLVTLLWLAPLAERNAGQEQSLE